MIIKAQDFRQRIDESCHGGTGRVYIMEYRSQNPGLGFRLLHETTIPAGATVGFHTHPGHEELYIIREGRGLVQEDDGRSVRVEPGDVCYTRKGSSHGLVNDGDVPLKMTVVGMNTTVLPEHDHGRR